ncbi:hypothetical protein LEMLEM_LOCUS26860 [Lemmus lemmus]
MPGGGADSKPAFSLATAVQSAPRTRPVTNRWRPGGHASTNHELRLRVGPSSLLRLPTKREGPPLRPHGQPIRRTIRPAFAFVCRGAIQSLVRSRCRRLPPLTPCGLKDVAGSRRVADSITPGIASVRPVLSEEEREGRAGLGERRRVGGAGASCRVPLTPGRRGREPWRFRHATRPRGRTGAAGSACRSAVSRPSVVVVEIEWEPPVFNFSSRNSSREEMVDELTLKEREGGSGWFFREFPSWFSKDLCSLRAYLKERNYNSVVSGQRLS